MAKFQIMGEVGAALTGEAAARLNVSALIGALVEAKDAGITDYETCGSEGAGALVLPRRDGDSQSVVETIEAARSGG